MGVLCENTAEGNVVADYILGRTGTGIGEQDTSAFSFYWYSYSVSIISEGVEVHLEYIAANGWRIG